LARIVAHSARANPVERPFPAALRRKIRHAG